MEGRTSDCRSFGSNHHPSSQSRKISIGVIDDSLVGMKSGAKNVQEVAVQNTEGLYCDLGKSIGRKTNEKVVADFTQSKQCEARQQFDSPCVSTRSLHLDASIAETASGTKRIFISPASRGKPSNSYEVKDAPATYSANVFADGTSILQSGVSERKFDNVHFQNQGGKDITAKRVEDLSFSPAINVEMVEKVGTDYEAGKTGKETEILRVKLWEILGTVSSPNDHQSKSQNPDKGVVNLNTEQNLAQKSSKAVKSGKSSDTIETDSEGPEQTSTRPRTRSSFRKMAPTKLHSNKAKNDARSSYKFKGQESLLIFEPGLHRSPHGSVHCSSSMSKKSKIRALKIKPSKICATDKSDAYHIDLETFRPKAQLSNANASLLRNITLKLPDCDNKPENVEEYCRPGTITKENFDQSLSGNMAEPPKDHNSTVDVEEREDVGNECLQNSLDPRSYLRSPTLKIDTPTYSSPSLSPKKSHVLKSPALVRGETVVEDATSIFRNLKSRKKDGYSNAKDFAEEDNDFIFRRKASHTRERETEGDRSESSCEKRIESSAGSGQKATEICTAEKGKFTLHPLKKLKFDNIESQKNSWTEEPSEQRQEDELERAVKLFCLELGKIKSRMKSLTVKKSSEILLSVADETDLQLQNVRSQIEKDVVKQTNLCKSKRKLLETIITEQQDKLKFIHEKFKQEVNQHLQYCKSTLRELEVQQVEIKGAMDKRRASHRNILLQAEEAVDERLNDSQRRIRGIQELARRKMLHLKKTIAACLEEGILTRHNELTFKSGHLFYDGETGATTHS